MYDEEKGTCDYEGEYDSVNQKHKCRKKEKCHYKSPFDDLCLLTEKTSADTKGTRFKRGSKIA